MAQKYRKIDPRIWADEDFVGMDHVEKLIVIYCLTSIQTNRIGIFRFSMAMAAEDLDTLPLTFREGFEKVCQTLNWEYDSASRTLYIPNWWRYNEPDNANWMISCLDDLHDVPRSYLLDKFKRNVVFLSRKCNVSVFEERFGNVMGNLPDTLPDTLGGTIPLNPPPNLKQKQKLKQNNTPYSPPQGDGDFALSDSPLDPREPKKRGKPRKNPAAEHTYHPRFEETWRSFRPFKMDRGSKSKAFEKWEMLPKSDWDLLDEAIRLYCDNRHRNGTITQAFVTFLNGDWRQHLTDPSVSPAVDPKEQQRLAYDERRRRDQLRKDYENACLQAAANGRHPPDLPDELTRPPQHYTR